MKILRITAKTNPEKEIELKQALKSALDKTSVTFSEVKNCCCKSLFEDNIIHIEQEWESHSSIEEYLKSKEYKYLIGAITVLGNIIKIQEITTSKTDEIIN
jgi:hypothetical protein